MLGAVVAQIVVLEATEHDPAVLQQSAPLDFGRDGPSRRPEGFSMLGLARPPDRQRDCNDDGQGSAGRGDEAAGLEYAGGVGVIFEPPAVKGEWRIQGPPGDAFEGRAELGLKSEMPRCPFGGGPTRQKRGGQYENDLSPKQSGRWHGRLQIVWSDHRPVRSRQQWHGRNRRRIGYCRLGKEKLL